MSIQNNIKLESLQSSFYGICNPLLDITTEVDQEFLSQYNLKSNDAILVNEETKDLSDYISKEKSCLFSAGGSGQNTMRAAAWLLPPNSVVYSGCIGNDKYGELLKQESQKDGLKVVYQVDENTPTGTCAVLLNGKNRSMVANISAANNFHVDSFKQAQFQQVLQDMKVFYVTGFLLTVSPQTFIEIGEHCKQNQKTYCMNLSAPFICQFFKDGLLAALPYVDYLFGNESEFLAFAENNGLETTDLKQIAQRVSQMTEGKERTVVITQGCDPTIVCRGDVVLEFPVGKIDQDLIVDTNGAGDCFLGGFMSQLLQGQNIDTCVQVGHETAKMCIQRSGISFPEVKPESLIQLLTKSS